jgi:hypothetical protein
MCTCICKLMPACHAGQEPPSMWAPHLQNPIIHCYTVAYYVVHDMGSRLSHTAVIEHLPQQHGAPSTLLLILSVADYNHLCQWPVTAANHRKA